MLTPFAFGYRGRSHDAALTDLSTGGALAAVCLATLAAWAVVWRRALRADGVLTRRPRGRARAVRRADRDGAAGPAPDQDQVLTALRELVAPMLYPAVIGAAEPVPAVGEEPPPMAELPVARPPATEAAEAAETAAAGELPVAAEPVSAAAPAAARPVPVAARAGAVIPEPRHGAESRNGAESRHGAGGRNAAESRHGAGGRNAADRSGGIAVIESMLARAEPLMPGYEEEETW